MNALAPPKQKRRLCGTALRNAELLLAYRLLAILQAPFAFMFWLIEQRKGRFADRIENGREDE
jgi:hypothetical protein